MHMGGLGDVCLSESTILSVVRHNGCRLRAVGNKAVLDAFGEYFSSVESIDGRGWACLFSDSAPPPRLDRVVYIGKDRTGEIRRRIARFAAHVVFIDMYPEGRAVHVEEYQLGRLASYGIAPVRMDRQEVTARRVVLYPERPYRKTKWPVERFREVHEALRRRGVEAVIMGQPGLDVASAAVRAFDGLSGAADFLAAGGVFLSNDSGMAHFAARCGLTAATLFLEADPLVWRPKGGLVLEAKGAPPGVDEAVDFIMNALSNG